MSIQAYISPTPGTEPTGYINPGDACPRPFGVIYLDGERAFATLSLGQLDDDEAVAYLDHLADAATDLAAQIRRRQRGLARLLDAVEATDGAGAR